MKKVNIRSQDFTQLNLVYARWHWATNVIIHCLVLVFLCGVQLKQIGILDGNKKCDALETTNTMVKTVVLDSNAPINSKFRLFEW